MSHNASRIGPIRNPELRPGGRDNNQLARERDQRAFDFLEIHAATAEQLVEAGIYPNVEKARERMARAVKRGQVRLIGYVQNAEGRDVKLFARFPVSKPQHEYEVTQLLLGAFVDSVARGNLVDHRLADAELTINEFLLYLELDRGTMGYAEFIARLDKYKDWTGRLLVVMSSQVRIDGLLKRTQGLPNNFLFTTYDKARTDFHGQHWQTPEGVTVSVERSFRASVTA